MTTFSGSVQVPGEPGSSVRAEVYIGPDRLVLSAAGGDIGDWDLGEVTISTAGHRFSLEAEGEQLLFDADDPEAFAGAARVAPPLPPPEPADEFEALREKAIFEEQDRMLPRVAWAMLAASVLLLAGAIIPWDAVTAVPETDVPVGEILVGLSALVAAGGAYLGYWGGRRTEGGYVAVGAGVVALGAAVVAALRSDVGLGYVLTLVAAPGLVALGVLALTTRQTPADLGPEENDRPEENEE